MTSHGFASQSHQLNYEYSSVAHTHLLTRKNTNQPKGHYRINSVVCGVHTPVLFPGACQREMTPGAYLWMWNMSRRRGQQQQGNFELLTHCTPASSFQTYNFRAILASVLWLPKSKGFGSKNLDAFLVTRSTSYFLCFYLCPSIDQKILDYVN